ncbi:30S ribosomal protein S17 [bacterium]|nr:30S ribosomal protein S17 [bacterium]
MPKKTMIGVVVSDKMDKTVVVRVEKIKIHPKFKKHYKIHKKYKAHDEKNECKKGDLVIIQETRPLSKEKRWRVVKILSKQELLEEKASDEQDIEKEEKKSTEEKTQKDKEEDKKEE